MILIIVVVLTACNGKPCLTYGVEGLTIKSATDVELADTALKVVRYKQNSSFQVPVDSFRNGNGGYATSYLMILFDTSTKAPVDYEYDFLCTLYPSGKTYKVTNVIPESGRGKYGLTCVNPVHYTVNGNTAKTQNGYMGMEGFILEVPY